MNFLTKSLARRGFSLPTNINRLAALLGERLKTKELLSKKERLEVLQRVVSDITKCEPENISYLLSNLRGFGLISSEISDQAI